MTEIPIAVHNSKWLDCAVLLASYTITGRSISAAIRAIPF